MQISQVNSKTEVDRKLAARVAAGGGIIMQSARFETASTFSIATPDAPLNTESTTSAINVLHLTDRPSNRSAPCFAHLRSFKPPSLRPFLG